MNGKTAQTILNEIKQTYLYNLHESPSAEYLPDVTRNIYNNNIQALGNQGIISN